MKFNAGCALAIASPVVFGSSRFLFVFVPFGVGWGLAAKETEETTNVVTCRSAEM